MGHQKRRGPPVAPFQIVDDARQIKAFADPLRIRVLNVLSDRAATNQQIAQALGQPQARVLYHVRFLLDVGLIRLVEERVKGGNVEKYYRATARLFGLRPTTEFGREGLASAALDAVRQEVAASEAAWPDVPVPWESRRLRLPQERVDEFYERLIGLVHEYWGGPDTDATAEGAATVAEDPRAPGVCFAAVIYRDPQHGHGDASPEPS
jgi:DNA-binding transcriptional ArsR family regulator